MSAAERAATPRTDVEQKRTASVGAMSGMDQAWEDMVYHARTLERDLAAAVADRQALADAITSTLQRIRGDQIEHAVIDETATVGLRTYLQTILAAHGGTP